MSYTIIENSLKSQFYYKVPFSIGMDQIHEAVNAFMQFLKEPLEVKQFIQFSVNPLSRRGDVGYIERDPKDSIYNDSKEYFHFHAAIFDRYAEFLQLHPAVERFAKAALPIWQEARKVGMEIIHQFENQFPGISNHFFKTKESEILLRFLKYNWQKSEKYLAKPHYDAGSCTLAIAESTTGLRIGSHPENLQLIEHKPYEAIFMMSKNFPKLTDPSFIPSWHDVIQTEDKFIGKPYARWAVVCFFEAEGMFAEPRNITHMHANESYES